MCARAGNRTNFLNFRLPAPVGKGCGGNPRVFSPRIDAEKMKRTGFWHEKSSSPPSVDKPVGKFMTACGTAWIAQVSLQNAYFLGICSFTSAPQHMVVWIDLQEFFTHSWADRLDILNCRC